MNNIYAFNFIIIICSLSILVGFFIYNINNLFTDRDDYYEMIKASQKVCIKFDYNGILMEYNDNFTEIALMEENIIGKDIFKIINLSDEENIIKFISQIDKTKYYGFKSSIVNKEGIKINFDFVGFATKNIFGIAKTFILVGTDISKNNLLENEILALKNMNKSVNTELTYLQEELQRNSEQIQFKQQSINNCKNKHNLFMESLQEGTMEYDFETRTLLFSKKFLQNFININFLRNMNKSEIVKNFAQALTDDSYYDLLEALSRAFNKTDDFFKVDICFKRENKKYQLCGNIFYSDKKDKKELYYMVIKMINVNDSLV